MTVRRHLLKLAAVAALAAALAPPAAAQGSIKIGELNSYKIFAAFLEPYKKGMELALAEENAAGGVLGRKLEIDLARRQRHARATRCASPRS